MFARLENSPAAVCSAASSSGPLRKTPQEFQAMARRSRSLMAGNTGFSGMALDDVDICHLAHGFAGARAEHDTFQQRIARQAVCAVNASTSHFPGRIQTWQRGESVQIRLYATHGVMRGWPHRRLHGFQIHAIAETRFINARESVRAQNRQVNASYLRNALASPVARNSMTIERETTSRGASSLSGW